MSLFCELLPSKMLLMPAAAVSTIVGLGLNPDGNLEGWIAGLDSQPVPVPEPRSTGGTLVLLGLIGMRLFKPRFQEQKIKTIS